MPSACWASEPPPWPVRAAPAPAAAPPVAGGSARCSSGRTTPASSRASSSKLIDAWNWRTGHPAELIDGGADYEEVAQKVNAALAGGDLPDVFASDVNWFSNFALNEAVTPLDDLWRRPDDSSTYVDTLREDYNFNHKHYCAPYARSPASCTSTRT
ncbi:extracellular solute-binding protein [Kocuria rhizophila]|nr:extracellular solute-binding protein [Kocuria rhizophila]